MEFKIQLPRLPTEISVTRFATSRAQEMVAMAKWIGTSFHLTLISVDCTCILIICFRKSKKHKANLSKTTMPHETQSDESQSKKNATCTQSSTHSTGSSLVKPLNESFITYSISLRSLDP